MSITERGEFRLHSMSTKRGRPTIKKRGPLTATERQRRWRRNKTAKAQRTAARKSREEAERLAIEKWRDTNSGQLEAAERHYQSLEWRRCLDFLDSLHLGPLLAEARRVVGDDRLSSWLRREFLASDAMRVRDVARFVTEVLK